MEEGAGMAGGATNELSPAPVAPMPPIAPTPTAIVDRTYDETTRRRLMYLLVAGFFLYSSLLAALMALKGWELSPTANAIVIMTLQSLITAMTAAISYYYGTTMSSAQKGAMITDLQRQRIVDFSDKQ